MHLRHTVREALMGVMQVADHEAAQKHRAENVPGGAFFQDPARVANRKSTIDRLRGHKVAR